MSLSNSNKKGFVWFFKFSFISFFLFCLCRAVPKAYGSCQARSLIRAVATDLFYSLSKARSKSHLPPTPQLARDDPLSGIRDQTQIVLDTSQVCFFFFCFLFFVFEGHMCGIWKFPDQGFNRSCSCWPQPQHCGL